jgi:ankyrin repeat protein
MKLSEFLAYLADEPGWMNAGPVGIMTRDSSGDTPLHAALWGRDDEAARALVDAGADVNALGDMSSTPLHAAIAQGNTEMVKYLTTHGASWDVVSELGSSPRDRARRSDNPELRAMAEGADG